MKLDPPSVFIHEDTGRSRILQFESMGLWEMVGFLYLKKS